MLDKPRGWPRNILYTLTDTITQTPKIPAFVGERAAAGHVQSESDRRIRREESKMAECELKEESES
jgi:hypothetical protein